MNSLKSFAAVLLTGLLAFAGLTATAAPASAAEGDVAGATLDWGIKTSFTNYIQGPIAHGGFTVTGGVSSTAPFSWTGGTGTAEVDAATGWVGYGSSIHFTGHDGLLDVTFSDIQVVQHDAATASIVLDAVYSGLAEPGVFTTVSDIQFATVDLASATNASDGATVSYSGAPAVLTEAGAAAFAGFYAAGTALDAVSFTWPVEGPPPPPVPTVTVSKTAGLHPGGETITVTGTGFDPQPPATNGTRPPLAGQFGGAYVVFGKFADTWKPSAGAPSSVRKVGDQKWVVDPANVAALGAQAVAIQPDGSFTVTLSATRNLDAFAGNYGIYTYGGAGATYAPFETYTPVSFTTTPIVAVSQTSDLDPKGATVTVTGWNFLPSAPATNGTRPPLAGKFGGAYVVFGKFADVWQPSAGAPSTARKVGTQAWLVDAADAASIGATALNADGSFSVTIDLAKSLDASPGNYGIYTYAGSGAVHAPFESYTPIAFTPATVTSVALTASPSTGLVAGHSTTLTATVSPVAAGTIAFSTGSTVLATKPVDGTGSATLAITGLVEGSTTYSATFTPSDPIVFAPSTSAPLVVEVGPAPPVPTITVSKTEGLHPGGETVTVTGTGFSPQPPATTGTRPPLAGQFGGAYVVFGRFADAWRPSAGAPSASRTVGDQKWVVDPSAAPGLGSSAVAIDRKSVV